MTVLAAAALMTIRILGSGDANGDVTQPGCILDIHTRVGENVG